MRSRHWPKLLTIALVVAALASCTSASDEATSPTTAADPRVTVGSFDFAESELLAELYSQALEGGGFTVRREFGLGPREFVAPALARGLVDLVPEYAGTAVQFLTLGSVQPGPDEAETHRALVRALDSTPLTALEPAPAQDANAFVVSRATAERLGLRSLSDVAPVAAQLTFGGPTECSSRPYCLLGLERVYGLRFKEVVSLDAGGPLTRQALQTGVVDMALLFTTDSAIGFGDFVALEDDRHLQPAENVTPLVRSEVVEKVGAGLVERVNAVSAELTTEELRGLNLQVEDGSAVSDVASAWLRFKGLR